MTYKYHDLVWAKLLQKRCKAKYKLVKAKGRCELKHHHPGDHAVERGMEWVRWNNVGQLWFTLPGEADQSLTKGHWIDISRMNV